MTIQHINPDALYDGTPFGLSQAAVDTDSGLVFVSGQVDWDTDFQLKNSELAAQAENTLNNLDLDLDLDLVLAQANSSAKQILQLRIYVRGELSESMEKIVPVIIHYLNGARPALTGVGVASLATPDTLVEIEAVAKITR